MIVGSKLVSNGGVKSIDELEALRDKLNASGVVNDKKYSYTATEYDERYDLRYSKSSQGWNIYMTDLAEERAQKEKEEKEKAYRASKEGQEATRKENEIRTLANTFINGSGKKLLLSAIGNKEFDNLHPYSADLYFEIEGNTLYTGLKVKKVSRETQLTHKNKTGKTVPTNTFDWKIQKSSESKEFDIVKDYDEVKKFLEGISKRYKKK